MGKGYPQRQRALVLTNIDDPVDMFEVAENQQPQVPSDYGEEIEEVMS